MHPLPDRVAEVTYQARPDHSEISYASGYRVTKELVMTAAHGLSQGLSVTVWVPSRGESFAAEVVWLGDRGFDVALLRICDPPENDDLPPVLPGELPSHAGQVEFRAIGFPRFAERQGRRQSVEFEGTIQLGSTIKNPGLIALNVTTAVPPNADPDWKGVSGAAVFTADDWLLVGVVSQSLPSAGSRYAEATRLTSAPDENFWYLLERRPSEAGSLWNSVISHRTYVERLADFELNLTSGTLPFLAPSGHPSSPSNLLNSLEKSSHGGILLSGGAGAGKTRTCIEVAELAVDRGWRVFHVVAQGTDVIIPDIAGAVLRDTTPAIVILDNLNEQLLAGVDLTAIRRNVLETAERYGVRVGVLASARPGWLRRAPTPVRSELRKIFEPVSICDDISHLRAVSQRIAERAAPNAYARFGQDLFEICGHRPTIALLIAHEVEARIKEGRTVPSIDRLRAGELLGWLEMRLAEDELETKAEGEGFQLVTSSPELQACAAAAAACPQPRRDIDEAAKRVLEFNSRDGTRANGIIDRLLDMKWLEYHEPYVRAAHDVVIDQLLENTLAPQAELSVDHQAADAIQQASLGRARTVGIFAGHLGRLLHDLALDDDDRGLAQYCEDWLLQHADQIGKVLKEAHPYEGSYALGGILTGPPWAAATIRAWDRIVMPWMEEFGQKSDAQHLFYVALPKLDGDQAEYLSHEAIKWLDSHLHRPQAQFVLSRLLARPDLTTAAAKDVIRRGLAWLSEYDEIPEAQFVLQKLLRRRDLAHDDAILAITHALVWLSIHTGTSEARFVLDTLLQRRDMDAQSRSQVVHDAFVWLDSQDCSFEERFVLRPLLRRRDLAPSEAAKAISYSLSWLEAHTQSDEIRFVLQPLLQRTDLSANDAALAISHSLSWLSKYNQDLHADFVINSLLSRPDLTSEDSSHAMSFAFTWLSFHGQTGQAPHVLSKLLEREDLSTHDLGHAAHSIVAYLETAGRAIPPNSLVSVLRRPDLSSEIASVIVDHACTWLDENAGGTEVGAMLQALLGRPDIDDSRQALLRDHTFAWLRNKVSSTISGSRMRLVLDHFAPSPLPADTAALIENWIGRNPKEVHCVISSLARNGFLTSGVVKAILRHTKGSPAGLDSVLSA